MGSIHFRQFRVTLGSAGRKAPLTQPQGGYTEKCFCKRSTTWHERRLARYGNCFIVLLFLCDSAWFSNQSEISLGQFLVIHEPVWTFFGAILSDLWTNLKLLWVILSDLWTTLKFLWGNSQWFLVIHKPLWSFFGAIVGDSQTSLKFLWGDSQWFMGFFQTILKLIIQEQY